VTFRFGDLRALPWEEPRLDEEGERISRDNEVAMYVVDFSDVFECACSLCYALFDFPEPGKVLARRVAEREMKRLADVAPHFLVCGK